MSHVNDIDVFVVELKEAETIPFVHARCKFIKKTAYIWHAAYRLFIQRIQSDETTDYRRSISRRPLRYCAFRWHLVMKMILFHWSVAVFRITEWRKWIIRYHHSTHFPSTLCRALAVCSPYVSFRLHGSSTSPAAPVTPIVSSVGCSTRNNWFRRNNESRIAKMKIKRKQILKTASTTDTPPRATCVQCEFWYDSDSRCKKNSFHGNCRCNYYFWFILFLANTEHRTHAGEKTKPERVQLHTDR